MLIDTRKLKRIFVNVMGKWYPKDERLLLFGARRGDWYMDCSQHLYEWVVANHPEFRPVWMTKSKQVYTALRERGLPVCMQDSRRALWLLCRARIGLISTQLLDLYPDPSFIPDSMGIVFLGHGKSGKASTLAFASGRSKKFERMFERTRDLLLCAMATSPFIAELSAKANGFPLEKYVITGFPRNDEIVAPSPVVRRRWRKYLGDLLPNATLLYAPTWRQRGPKTRFFPFEDFSINGVAEWLRERRFLLLLRPHDRDLENNPDLVALFSRLCEASPWVRICDQHAFSNVNHVLAFTDLLISDYSSIYHDFLLLDRPMVFVPYDFEDFSRTQGFMYDYHALLPGPAVYSLTDFMRKVDDALTDPGSYRAARQQLSDLVHSHRDGSASERVMGVVKRFACR